jgi:hypothetical protein
MPVHFLFFVSEPLFPLLFRQGGALAPVLSLLEILLKSSIALGHLLLTEFVTILFTLSIEGAPFRVGRAKGTQTYSRWGALLYRVGYNRSFELSPQLQEKRVWALPDARRAPRLRSLLAENAHPVKR